MFNYIFVFVTIFLFDYDFVNIIVEWYMNFEYTKYMISYRLDFIEYTKLKTFEKIFIINEISIEMIDKKIVNFIKLLFNDDEIIVQLQKMLHMSQLSANLFSTTHIIRKNKYVIFDKNDCTIFEKKIDKFVLHVFKSRNQYSFNLIK